MSNLAEKFHGFLNSLRGGADIAAHDVEDVVAEVTSHLNEVLIPAIESKLSTTVPDMVQKAVNAALAAERAEAERISAKLEEIYKKFVDEYGHGAANAAMGGAVAPDEAVTAAQAASGAAEAAKAADPVAETPAV